MDFNSSLPEPEGVISFLDTDLYKLTMQCAVFQYYRDIPITYAFTNRTPDKKLSRKAYNWLKEQITKLGNICLQPEEKAYLQKHCKYLHPDYINFLDGFRLDPREQVAITFIPASNDTGSPEDLGDVHMEIKGKWVDAILYEIPILALTSEAYFKFMDTDWSYDGQQDKAKQKGLALLEAGCIFSEFGTRRRRDYHTQALVFKGLRQAAEQAEKAGHKGKLSGTSNVHLAMRFGIPPVGTVAHEWFMGIAAITGNYAGANEEALSRWTSCFGEGVLAIALTDTFGTDAFLRAFKQPVKVLLGTPAGLTASQEAGVRPKSYAEVFTGVRQDSGDPAEFVKTMKSFYDAFYRSVGVTHEDEKPKKTIVFSDSLNIELCLKYKKVADEAGFQPTFGVGTFLTNDFNRLSDGSKSTPMNIVIKLSSADGNPAVKISDNAGKNTGDKETVEKVKREVEYVEKGTTIDEAERWGVDGNAKSAN